MAKHSLMGYMGMSEYHKWIKNSAERAFYELMAEKKKKISKICKKCGGVATGWDCEGAFLFPCCDACNTHSPLV